MTPYLYTEMTANNINIYHRAGWSLVNLVSPITSFKSEIYFSHYGSRLEFVNERKLNKIGRQKRNKVKQQFFFSQKVVAIIHSFKISPQATTLRSCISSSSQPFYKLFLHRQNVVVSQAVPQSAASPSLSYLPFPCQARGIDITLIHRQRLRVQLDRQGL